MKKKKILITGGSGMLGSALKDLLETNAASTQTEVDILALDSKTDLRNRDVTYELCWSMHVR